MAAFNRSGWLRLPVGAMAILAVTVVSFRHYSSSDRVYDDALDVGMGNKSAIPAKTSAIAADAKPAGDVPAVPLSRPVMSNTEAAPRTREANRVVPEATPPLQVAGLIQQAAEATNSADVSEFEPLKESLAIRFRSPGSLDPVQVEMAARPVGFEERSISMLRSHFTAELLPTAVAVTDQRRSRLLSALGSAGTYAAEPSAPEHAKRSVIRDLSEDGWDRSMSRLQAEADHLSIRF
jgi:hypothetical protein